MTAKYTVWPCQTLTGQPRYRILENGRLVNGHPIFRNWDRALDYAAAHTDADAGKEVPPSVTENELAALCGIYQSEFQDSGNRVDHWVWVWSANPWDSTPASKKFGGVMASLNKKGLAKSDRAAGRDACVCLTALGVAVLKEGRSL